MSMPQPDSPHYRGRPSSGTKTGRVWDIADELSRQLGRRATHKEVKKRYVDEENGEPTTCMTTYYQWKSSFDVHSGGPTDKGVSENIFSSAPIAEDRKIVLTIAADGRVVIPASMRRAMRLDPDGRVTAILDEDGVLTLIAPGAAIAKAQRYARLLDRGQGSVVDELIAERRAEAALEDAQD